MTEDRAFDLTVDSAQHLARDAELDDLKAAVRRLDQWTERAARTLDVVNVGRLVRLLGSQKATREDLTEFIDYLGWLAHDRFREQLNNLERRYFDRWDALRDLVIARREVVGHSNRGAILGRKHVAAVIAELSDGPQPQSELGRRLDLQKVNLTRVLNLMEAHGLIERAKEGTEKHVHLAGAAKDRARSSSGRWSTYLTRSRKAA